MFDEISALIVEAREANEVVLTDVCDVTRVDPNDLGSFDPATGATAGDVVRVHVGLPCSLREPARESRESLAGEHLFQQGDAVLRVDAGYSVREYEDGDSDAVSGSLRVGDTVTIVSSPQGTHVAQNFTVVWPISGSHMSSARFVVRKVM